MGRRRRQVGSESRLLQHSPLAVVNCAFGYIGKKVARRLLGEGIGVRTLTRSPDWRDPFGGRLPWTSLTRMSFADLWKGRASSSVSSASQRLYCRLGSGDALTGTDPAGSVGPDFSDRIRAEAETTGGGDHHDDGGLALGSTVGGTLDAFLCLL